MEQFKFYTLLVKLGNVKTILEIGLAIYYKHTY
jgi:hypothetical protein